MVSRQETKVTIWGNESGGVILLFALLLGVLLVATGLAIDYGRAQMMQSKLHAAVDSGGLAAGSIVNTHIREQTSHLSGSAAVDARQLLVQREVDSFVRANFPEANLTRIDIVNYTEDPNDGSVTIGVTATGEVDTTLMSVFGFGTVDIFANSEVVYGKGPGLEVVMVLDITGSMRGGNKIGSLRLAAEDLTNIIFGSSEVHSNLWVSIVPYVSTVNVGADKVAWLRDYDPANYPAGTSWKGCVEARGQHNIDGPNDMDILPTLPTTGNTLFPTFYWESSTINDWWDPVTGTINVNEEPHYTDANGSGPNMGCGSPIMPLTNVKSEVVDEIRALIPWGRGGTSSVTGMTWGLRSIDPSWRGMWGSPSLPHAAGEVNKTVVVITDGINQFLSTEWDVRKSDYTAYNRIQDQNLGPGVDTIAEGAVAINNKFQQVCTLMKQDDITIYAITFGLGSTAAENAARVVFRDCATTPDHYFDSPDGASLRTAFREIGAALTSLRLSQ